MIEIGNGNYFCALWFLSKAGVPIDIMGALFRAEGETAFRFVYRIRFHAAADQDQNPFAFNDDKQWFKATTTDPEEVAFSSCRRYLALLAEHLELEVSELHVRSADALEIFKAIRTCPGYNVMPLPAAGEA